MQWCFSMNLHLCNGRKGGKSSTTPYMANLQKAWCSILEQTWQTSREGRYLDGVWIYSDILPLPHYITVTLYNLPDLSECHLKTVWLVSYLVCFFCLQRDKIYTWKKEESERVVFVALKMVLLPSRVFFSLSVCVCMDLCIAGVADVRFVVLGDQRADTEHTHCKHSDHQNWLWLFSTESLSLCFLNKVSMMKWWTNLSQFIVWFI